MQTVIKIALSSSYYVASVDPNKRVYYWEVKEQVFVVFEQSENIFNGTKKLKSGKRKLIFILFGFEMGFCALSDMFYLKLHKFKLTFSYFSHFWIRGTPARPCHIHPLVNVIHACFHTQQDSNTTQDFLLCASAFAGLSPLLAHRSTGPLGRTPRCSRWLLSPCCQSLHAT